MTKWFHECDLGWLRARRNFLTATDIKELLPVTKTGRKRIVTDENYLKVLSKKLVNLTQDDCKSIGAAARGHVLEPFAIDAFNRSGAGYVQLNHWDDKIVTRKNSKKFELAFSPDAMDIEQGGVDTVVHVDPKVIGEVKCYSPERHLTCGFTLKDELEERWQIAAAMATCDSIEEAYLIFFNPSMDYQLFVSDYDRDDLKDEIKIVKQIEKDWLLFVDKLDSIDSLWFQTGDPNNEQYIIRQIMKQEELNPDGMKTVVK